MLTSLEGKCAINATALYDYVAISNIYLSPSFIQVLEIKTSFKKKGFLTLHSSFCSSMKVLKICKLLTVPSEKKRKGKFKWLDLVR